MKLDFVLKNGLIITQDDCRNIIHRGDVRIRGDRIVEIGTGLSSETVLDATGKIITPAFINTHVHLGETVFRGYVDGLDLPGYIELTEKIYEKFLAQEPEIRRVSAHIAFLELIRCGTSVICAGRGWDEIDQSGLKGFLGYPLVRSKKLSRYVECFDSEFEKIYDRSNQGRIRIGLFIPTLLKVNQADLEAASKKLTAKPDLLLTVHIAETQGEVEEVFRGWGASPIKVLDSHRLLCNRTLLVHCVWLSEEDFRVIRRRNARVALCPVSNLKLKAGFPAIDKFIDYGINISLATDGPATNNSMSLLEVAKITGLVSDADTLDAQKLFDLITRDAAACLGCISETGTIEPGKYADLAIFNGTSNLLAPQDQLISNLVFAGPTQPESVIVNGEFLMRDRRVLTVSERTAIEEFNAIVSRLYD